MAKWIAEGATVLEEGGEADDWICVTMDDFAPKPWAGGDMEAAQRMAQQIADEHNRLQEIETRLGTATLALKDIFDNGDDRPASWAFYVTRAEIALARIGALAKEIAP